MANDNNFVTSVSLRNYAVATGSLTLVINVILYVYSSIKSNVMPLGLLIPIALLLSILYIISFFKRDDGLNWPQYIWTTLLNSLMLFTSISGVNGMLDTARKQFDAQNAKQSSAVIGSNTQIQEASVGDFFKNLIFPTHGWFNTGEAQQRETQATIHTAIENIDTTQKLVETLINQKTKDIQTIDTLHQTVDTLRTRYLKVLDLFQQAQVSITSMQNILEQRNIPHNAPVEIARLTTPVIETEKNQLQLQQVTQQQQQQQQQKVQVMQIKTLQQQQQQLQQQKRRLQQQQIDKR